MKRWPFRLLVAAGVAIALVAVAVLAFGPTLLRTAISGAGHAAGYGVSYGRIENRNGHLVVEAPDVTGVAGEPLFTARKIEVAYDLRDALHGPYLFGVHGIEIDRPKLTIVHHADGSYNFKMPASGVGSSAPPKIPKIRLLIKDGSIGILDATKIFKHSQRLAFENLQLDADVDPARRSHLVGGLTILEEGGKFPFSLVGTLDEARGYELTHVRAKTLALAPLFDYAVNSRALHASNGVLNAIDARIYGLADKHGAMHRHLVLSANLDHFQPYLGGLTKPLRDGRGALRLFDEVLAIPKVDGSIAAVPVRIAGAIYDLISNPRVRLGITGHGDLRRLITLSDASKHFPLSGPVAFKLLVEGAAAQPTTLAAFSSPRVAYARFPFDRPNGLVALHGVQTSVLHAGLGYDGIAVGTRGDIVQSGKHTNVDLLATVTAPTAHLPYARDLLGPMTVAATVVAAGTDAKLATTGVFAGGNERDRLAGTFAVDGRGEGTVGPLTLIGPGDRDLYARVALDRPHFGGGAAFVTLHDFRVATSATQPALPGVSLPAAPAFTGTLDGQLAGAFQNKRFTLGGDARARNVVALGYPVDDLTFQGNVRDGGRVAARLRYRGALAALARAGGGKVAARGRVDIPVAVVATGTQQALAQISGARFEHASVGGVSLDGLEGTVGLRGHAVDVYGVRAGLGRQNIVARGSFGNGGVLDVSASGIDLAALRGLGLPVESGTVSAVASIGGTTSAPVVAAGIAASGVRSTNPRASQLPIDAGAALAFSGDTLDLRDASVLVGPAVSQIDGTVTGVRSDPKNAHYAFAAHVREADIGTLATLVRAPQYPEGTLDADVQVAGRGTSPAVSGHIAIPEGSINGLDYRDAAVDLAGSAAALRARRGSVTVGTSTVAFDADVTRASQRLALRAPHIDLSDFNDYFDRGDTLGGRGSLALAVRNAPDALAAQGRLRLSGTRFRRFDVGAAAADVSTTGRTIHSTLGVGSKAGRVTGHGSVTLAATQPLRDTLHRSSLAFDARAQGIDLATWLPAVGIAAPVFGTVDASARVRGTYPNVDAQAHAALAHGLVDRIPIRVATIDASATRGRATIANAALAIDNLTANASGSVGLTPRGPLALTVNAQTGDVGALAKSVTGTTYDAAGSVRSTLRVTGTAQNPVATDVTEARAIRYARYTVPRAHAELAVTRTRASLRNTEVDLTAGRLLASGSAPLQAQPFGIGPARAPLALSLLADNIDVGQFGALLPKGTVVTGALNGRVGLVGSLAKPALDGGLALTNGSFVGPQLKSKVTKATAHLAFAGSSATLNDTSATIGGGTITATGRASVPSLRSPGRDLSGSLQLAFNNPVLNAPQYLRGRVDGTLTVARTPAAPIAVGGNLALSSTRIPLSAIFNPSASTTPNAPAPLPVAFNLNVDVGRDVRVQSGPVDIAGTGDLHVGGTLAAPTVGGQLTTVGGGTLSFYRTFRVQDGSTATFDPSDGAIPTVDVVATTTVTNPSTDVTLHVTGPATQLNVALASDPAYSREQILGLLVGAQALGAVSGVQTAQGTPSQNPFQSAAEGQLGTLLTQNVFEPFSSQLGGALGLSDLAFNYLPGGGASVGAKKQIFRNINVVFADSFNYPQRQSVGLQAAPNPNTAAQVTFYTQPGSNQFAAFQPNAYLSSNQSVSSAEPSNGNQGLSFSLQRKF